MSLNFILVRRNNELECS